jgi:hypothetical protein
LETFKEAIRARCGLQLQVQKTEIYSRTELNQGQLQGMKRAGVEVGGEFFPGFVCYGIPIGHPSYLKATLEEKAEEVVGEMEEICSILGNDSQALWVVLHRSQDGLPPLTLLPLGHPPHSHLPGQPALGHAGEGGWPADPPL